MLGSWNVCAKLDFRRIGYSNFRWQKKASRKWTVAVGR